MESDLGNLDADHTSTHPPVSIQIDALNDGLSPSQYASATQDDVNGDVFYDALDIIDTSDDIFYYTIGDVTLSNDDSGTVYAPPSQGPPLAHNERVYRHTSGDEFRVFVSESEDNTNLPTNHQFWSTYFSRQNVTRHIYQGIIDSSARYNISAKDIKQTMSPVEPRVSTPTKFDHEAMRPYFAWLPLARIKKTFEVTTQFMQMPSSTYLRKRHRTPHPAANIL